MKDDGTRVFLRYPYRAALMYCALGDSVHPPDQAETYGEIVDLSNSGMRMRIEGRVLEEGNMLKVRIPVADMQATVPTLAQVVWTKRQDAKSYHAGLRFVVQ